MSDLEEIIRKLEAEAKNRTDGHITLMKFTTGWKAFYGTPDVTENRNFIGSLHSHKTLNDAVDQLADVPVDVAWDEDIDPGMTRDEIQAEVMGLSFAEVNGHKSWEHWNVSLWLLNDENSYKHAAQLIERHGEDKAADILADELEGETTPDGAPYTYEAIREAIRGLT